MMNTGDTVLFIIDVQDRLVRMLKNGDEIVRNNSVLAQSAKILGLPVIVSEQYPKGLGATVPEVNEYIDYGCTFEKTSFSAMEEDVIKTKLAELNIKNVILTGIEAHICVYQTALALMDSGYNLYVVKNAVSSRKSKDCKTALELMRDFGARLTCVETVLFELMKSSKHPHFKELQNLIK